MKKKKLLLIAGGAAVGIVVLVCAVLLFMGVAQLRRTQADLKSAENELEQFYTSKKHPFPSTQNVARIAENVTTLERWEARLIDQLSIGYVLNETERSPSVFQQRLVQQRNDLLALGGDAVDKVFNFGFDPYFAAEGARTVDIDPNDVPRLTLQLRIISDICTTLFEERITKLTAIRRDQFERMLAQVGGAHRVIVNPDAGLLHAQLFVPLSFTFEFETKEEALLRILNRLTVYEKPAEGEKDASRQAMFTVVRNLVIDRHVADVFLPEPKKEEEDGAAAEANVLPESASKEPLSREERLVCGRPEFEQPVEVKLDVDVYRFRGMEQK